MYRELNENIEKLSKIIHTSLVKLTIPGAILPFFLVSIFKYFTSETKEGVFRLPYPMMYISIECFQWSSEIFYSFDPCIFFRLPWNWNSLFGYFLAVLDQTACSFCTTLLERLDFYSHLIKSLLTKRKEIWKKERLKIQVVEWKLYCFIRKKFLTKLSIGASKFSLAKVL